ncbi:ATP synthase F1 subunit delta [Arachidicoccus sp.]|jgi:F-type H+-transporting ATPase subunit delta|uniref:ATP synthase F1 subunit delta n=1 Tax=Arachidicoccus sp. TaxID=1872624 RepID=UPI003D1C4D23
MQNPRLSAVYAKSLADLAIEQKKLDTIFSDMQYIKAVCGASREFVQLLKSPIIFADKKQAIINDITKGKVSDITAAFNTLLIKKGREGYLPQIADAFIEQYNKLNGINSVKVTTAVPLSEKNKNNILAKLKTEVGFDKVELETAVDADLIGGFVLEFNNNLVDASIARDLRDIKKQFQQNLYVQNIK